MIVVPLQRTNTNLLISTFQRPVYKLRHNGRRIGMMHTQIQMNESHGIECLSYRASHIRPCLIALPQSTCIWVEQDGKLTNFHHKRLQHKWIDVNMSTTKQVFNVFLCTEATKNSRRCIEIKPHQKLWQKKNK